MNDDPTEEEERLADELAEEALADLATLMTARERAAIKNELVDRLLFTDAGRLKLAAAAPPPTVEKSGTVARAGAEKKVKKAGSSS